MLGPGFAEFYAKQYKGNYIAPQELHEFIKKDNEQFDTGPETRLSKLFENDIWDKIMRSGLTLEDFNGKQIFELCGGTGFLTYHLLKRIQPLSYTFNDISQSELNEAKRLINEDYGHIPIEWVVGDLHELEIENKYDLVIGHSFIHHFYNVPAVMEKIFRMLKPGGVFISTGEPTYLSPLLEGRKWYLWPVAIFNPYFFIELIRKKNSKIPSGTDVWIFKYKELHKVAYSVGFEKCTSQAFNFLRAILPTVLRLNLNNGRKQHSYIVRNLLYFTLQFDYWISKILPTDSYAHISIVCKKAKAE
jgi:ubiquinone/menaquinone biosynthesis C-methylase UbiE